MNKFAPFRARGRRHAEKGASLIEVLVSLLILMLGLLGLVGVMIQSQRGQVESYQRVQALLLVQDMAARLNANKQVASCYVVGTHLGTASSVTPSAGACGVGSVDQKARMQQDLEEWQNLLLGSAELAGADPVGSVVGARGCITRDAGGEMYQVSVAWQGMGETVAPPTALTCGANSYGSEAARRAVSITIQIANLS